MANILERLQLIATIGLVIGSIYLFLKVVIWAEEKTDYYGGLLGTILAYVESIIAWCLLTMVVGWLIPGIDAGLGVWLGIFYCSYCWAKHKVNKIVFLIHHGSWPRD